MHELFNILCFIFVMKWVYVLAQVNCVLFNEEGTVIVSGSLDATIHTYDSRSRKLEPIQVGHIICLLYLSLYTELVH